MLKRSGRKPESSGRNLAVSGLKRNLPINESLKGRGTKEKEYLVSQCRENGCSSPGSPGDCEISLVQQVRGNGNRYESTSFS